MKVTVIQIVVSFLLFTIFSSTILALLISRICYEEEEDYNENEKQQLHQNENHYKFIMMMFNGDKTDLQLMNQGIVTLPYTFEEDYQFIGNVEEDNDTKDRFFLISKFGKKEYQCEGYCYCEEGEFDRRSNFARSTTSSRKLFYLLSSVSTISAFHFASKHFQEVCEVGEEEEEEQRNEKNNMKCSSEVISCEEIPINEGFTKFELEIEDEVEDLSGKVWYRDTKKFGIEDYSETQEWRSAIFNKRLNPREGRMFVCIGYCVPNHRFKRPDRVEMARRYGCEFMKAGAELSVRLTEIKPLSDEETEFYGRKLTLSERYNDIAVSKFVGALNNYCIYNTMEEFEYKKFDEGWDAYVKSKMKVPLCVGKKSKRMLFHQDSNVQCEVKFRKLFTEKPEKIKEQKNVNDQEEQYYSNY